ncbi:MAG: GNAT family N-acetyltransferase [Lachnospiraceae bacterium]
MNIEKVTVEDAQELLSIYAPYVQDTAITFEYEVPSLAEFEERIRSISAILPYIKAVEDGKILGYAYAGKYKSRKAYEWAVEATIYVRKEARRSGVGRLLYSTLEKSLKQIGVLNMNVFVVIPNGEDEHLTNDSYRFHKRMGYEEAGRFHKVGYKFGKWYDVASMEKMIGEHTAQQAEVRFGEWKI